jgi:hypothetical protein
MGAEKSGENILSPMLAVSASGISEPVRKGEANNGQEIRIVISVRYGS